MISHLHVNGLTHKDVSSRNIVVCVINDLCLIFTDITSAGWGKECQTYRNQIVIQLSTQHKVKDEARVNTSINPYFLCNSSHNHLRSGLSWSFSEVIIIWWCNLSNNSPCCRYPIRYYWSVLRYRCSSCSWACNERSFAFPWSVIVNCIFAWLNQLVNLMEILCNTKFWQMNFVYLDSKSF